MPFSHRHRLDIFVSGILAAFVVGPAAHAQAVNRFTTFMHSGPGLEYSVTDEIPNRTALPIETCVSGWCRIRFGGVPGWVQQKTLISGPSTAQPQPGERPTECMDFARTGWPDQGNLERVCIFQPNKPVEIAKPAG